jgi:E3 ubiquitin-protein ligase SIAH1
MDGLSRAVGEVMLSDLKCPVCMQYMVPPIRLCKNGHNTCSKCRERVTCCPTCRAKFLETRNVALENMARRLKYPCANRQRGCLDRFSIEHIAEHQAVCVYGKIECPFHLLKMCSWNGLKNDLTEHAKEAHPKYVWEGSSFNIIIQYLTFTSLSVSMVILSYFGELFTYYRKIKDGRLYCVVQLIGTSIEASKYKCEFTLRAANGVEQISKTLFVRGYSEDFESIFSSGICLCLDEKTVQYFLVKNKLKLTITLSRV